MQFNFDVADAATVDSVLRTIEASGLEAAWPAAIRPGDKDDGRSDPTPRGAGRTLAAVERSFPEAVAFDDLVAIAKGHASCLQMHGVRIVRSYFSDQRRRALCIYEAPDAEAIRSINRIAGLVFDRIWPAQVVLPPSPGTHDG